MFCSDGLSTYSRLSRTSMSTTSSPSVRLSRKKFSLMRQGCTSESPTLVYRKSQTHHSAHQRRILFIRVHPDQRCSGPCQSRPVVREISDTGSFLQRSIGLRKAFKKLPCCHLDGVSKYEDASIKSLTRKLDALSIRGPVAEGRTESIEEGFRKLLGTGAKGALAT